MKLIDMARRNPAPDADMMAPALDDGLMHDGNTGVTCPTCGGTAGCRGQLLRVLRDRARPARQQRRPPGYTAQCPVCSLDDSAEPGPISAEGYCESCGRKVPSGRDHVELNLELLAGVTDRGLRHPRNEDAMALATTETACGPVCDRGGLRRGVFLAEPGGRVADRGAGRGADAAQLDQAR